MMALRKYDGWLMLAALALILVGTLMVFSSTSVITPTMEKKKITAEFYYLKKHLITIVIGLVAMVFAMGIEERKLRKWALPGLGCSLVLLLLVFVPGLGVTAGGARRWIRLWPSTFQPSEFVKLAMVMFMAWYLSLEWVKRDSVWHFAAPIAVMGVFQLVFLKQPDFGSTVTLGVLTVAMLFVAGFRMKYIWSLVAMALPAVAYLLMEPYRMKRLISFLDPWKYEREGGLQLVQSFIAFGSGGWSGVGIGHGKQKLDFLPEVHTDFIFSMIGEELGLLAAIVVVGLFLVIFLRGMSISSRAPEGFAKYLTLGLTLMITLQAIVNFCVVTGLLPTKGLPLPFISYGGSALLVNMIAIGLLLNFSREREPEETAAKREELETILEMKKARMRRRA